MNFSEQQNTTIQTVNPAAYTMQPAAVAPQANPLAQLETRLSGMNGSIVALKNKITAMQEIITHREQRITALEMENAATKQQMDRFTASHGQLLDGLSEMLARFPTEESLETTPATKMDLMAETMGTA